MEQSVDSECTLSSNYLYANYSPLSRSSCHYREMRWLFSILLPVHYIAKKNKTRILWTRSEEQVLRVAEKKQIWTGWICYATSPSSQTSPHCNYNPKKAKSAKFFEVLHRIDAIDGNILFHFSSTHTQILPRCFVRCDKE